MDALKAFEPALKSGELAIQRGDIDPEVLFHLDRPNGETRFTYAKLLGETVAALAVIVMSDPLEGKPVFQIGYAVPQHLRKRGLAKDIANAAIAELQNGLARTGSSRSMSRLSWDSAMPPRRRLRRRLSAVSRAR